MAATLKQIAAKTGLSIPTVHQILNGYNAAFAEATRKKVLAAAAELNYQPNITARSLVTQRSFLIGVLFYGPNNNLVTPFMRGVQAEVKKHQCSPIFFTHNSAEEELENLQSVLARRVDAVIVNAAVDPGGVTNAKRYAELAKKGTSIVEVFGRFIPDVPHVTLDFGDAARVMTEHLIAAGHKRIAILVRDDFHESDPSVIGGRFWNATDFWKHYHQTIHAAGLTPIPLKYPVNAAGYFGNEEIRRTVKLVDKLFKKPQTAPTAIITYGEPQMRIVAEHLNTLESPSDQKLTVAYAGDAGALITDRVDLICFPMATEQAGVSAIDLAFKRIANENTPDTALKNEGQHYSRSISL